MKQEEMRTFFYETLIKPMNIFIGRTHYINVIDDVSFKLGVMIDSTIKFSFISAHDIKIDELIIKFYDKN